RNRVGLEVCQQHPAVRCRAGPRPRASRLGRVFGVRYCGWADHSEPRIMSATICIAPARTLAYPQGGGHLWVYLQGALGLRALGCRVSWLEGIDPRDPEHDAQEKIATLKGRLEPYGLAESVALFSLNDEPLPRDVAAHTLDLDAAAEADLLLNLWHSLPASVVRRFRRSAFVDTDPGLLQIWMTTGELQVARHDVYFSVGETVGTPAAEFPDCGLEWQHTPPPVFLTEWPQARAESGAPYTTVTHWWGGRVHFDGKLFSNDKLIGFLEYSQLPAHTPVPLEQAISLGRFYEEWRALLAPLGWRLREARDVSATPEQYRAYIQRSRGEFSCAKPVYVELVTGWISDRTACYLASGKPAVVQYTGPSRYLPDAEGLFRFKSMDEALRGLAQAESDYERQCRQARALAEEHFDARRVVGRVLDRALAEPISRRARTAGIA